MTFRIRRQILNKQAWSSSSDLPLNFDDFDYCIDSSLDDHVSSLLPCLFVFLLLLLSLLFEPPLFLFCQPIVIFFRDILELQSIWILHCRGASGCPKVTVALSRGLELFKEALSVNSIFPIEVWYLDLTNFKDSFDSLDIWNHIKFFKKRVCFFLWRFSFVRTSRHRRIDLVLIIRFPVSAFLCCIGRGFWAGFAISLRVTRGAEIMIFGKGFVKIIKWRKTAKHLFLKEEKPREGKGS